jgi:hypothetical protein
MQLRHVLLVAFACVALAASQMPEEVFAEPVAPLEEFVQDTDPEMDKLTHTMKGGVVTNEDEAIAHKEPSDVHDEVQCEEGQVVCPDGSCAAECPDFVATASFKGGAAGLSYTFPPNPTHLAAAPDVAGKETDYNEIANNFHSSETAAEQLAIVKAEQSAGLGFASHDSALAESEQRMAAKKQQVEKDMNLAAASAAAFKSASQAHDQAVTEVKKAQLAEKAQENVVEQAKATLKAELAKLKTAKEFVTAKVHSEENARYNAEYKGQLYETAKSKAIGEDNALQEELHETDEKEHFRKVAMAAVKEAAAKELLKAKKAAFSVPKATGSAEKPKEETCSDCTTLPQIYIQAGGKCSDCATWAKNGQCTQAQYSKFMAHYCAKSCGCPKAVPETSALQLTAPPSN